MPSTYLRDYLDSLQEQTSQQKRLEFAAAESNARLKQRQNENLTETVTNAFGSVSGAIQNVATLKYQEASKENREFFDLSAELVQKEMGILASGVAHYELTDQQREQINHYGGELASIMGQRDLTPRQKYETALQVMSDIQFNVMPSIQATAPLKTPRTVESNGYIHTFDDTTGKWDSRPDQRPKYENEQLKQAAAEQKSKDSVALKIRSAATTLWMQQNKEAVAPPTEEQVAPYEAMLKREKYTDMSDPMAALSFKLSQPITPASLNGIVMAAEKLPPDQYATLTPEQKQMLGAVLQEYDAINAPLPPDPVANQPIAIPMLAGGQVDWSALKDQQLYSKPDGSIEQWSQRLGKLIPIKR